ncbi:MAG: PqqD family protein [Spirochaetales bacterium]|jgi:hypothetical protein|nr:PqqD family protein [Spirochaetales bacterium]
MISNTAAYIIHRGVVDHEGLRRLSGADSQLTAFEAVGRQIAGCVQWKKSGGQVLVLRRVPEPLLVAFCDADVAEATHYERLETQIDLADTLGVYIDYHQAEANVACLAANLLEKYSRAELLQFSYTAIPRGGMFVLAMLSYLLNLPQSLINNPRKSSNTLVIVDDCSLSGYRFKEFLGEVDDPEVVFCPLYSHPDLRERIREHEPRVRAVLSGVDLVDHALELYGSSYSTWKQEWLESAGTGIYWTGQPDFIVFPWGAPDVAFPEAHGMSQRLSWSFIPELRSMKNRPLKSRPVDENAFQAQIEGPGPICCAENVVFADMQSDLILVADCGRDETAGVMYRLENSACMMFRALVEHGSIEPAAAAVAKYYDADRAEVRSDLASFLGELSGQGILLNA